MVSKKQPRTLAQCGRGGKAEKPLGLKKNNYGVSIKSLYQCAVTMLRATKVHIYPTPEQAEYLNAQFGAVRFAYNK
ncbi:helix-turn-helix domain-containing protein, partial [Escherichia coli]|nr:helix-turn-helix domain-containing protein [Escherichia coli]